MSGNFRYAQLYTRHQLAENGNALIGCASHPLMYASILKERHSLICMFMIWSCTLWVSILLLYFRTSSLAKTRRQVSLSKRLEWSSSESDDTIHGGDKTAFSPLDKSKSSFLQKNTNVGDRKHMRGILKSGSAMNSSSNALI